MAPFFRRLLRRGLGLASLAALSESLESIVARLAPSVVGLESPRRPLGSATVVRSDGLVVTAAHVVAGQRAIVATLADGRRVAARRVDSGGDPRLAFLALAASGVEPAPFGAASATRLGQLVIAIGRPPGDGPCAAAGVVAGLQRSPLDSFTTDARANGGASGGPIASALGRVIAVASIEATGAGGAVAGIPAAAVSAALSRASVTEIGLGGWDQILEEPLAGRLGVEGSGGVLVIDVDPGGAAEHAGLRPLDVVVRADGRRVQSLDALSRAVERAAAHSSAALELAAIRGDRLIRLRLAIEWRRAGAIAAP